MLVPVLNVNGETVGEKDLPESVFGVEPNIALMHQAVVRQAANARLGTHDTKTRGEVRGGGRKPYRQKGTGRARQGSTRSPVWRGGGIVFGPTPRKYIQDMPKKMRRAALCSALSVKLRDGQLTLVDSLTLGAARTKEMVQVLAKLQTGEDVLIALRERDENVVRASRNLPKVKVITAGYLSVRDLIDRERLVLPVSSVEFIADWLSSEAATGAEVSA